MAIIDSGNIDNLYFVGIYGVRSGSHYSSFTPRGNNQTEPIKYLSEIIIKKSGFIPYQTVKATPENYMNDIFEKRKLAHKWMVKKEKLNLRPKSPRPSKKNCEAPTLCKSEY